jgi:hypothetical protein
MNIELQDLSAFKSAVAGYVSLTTTRLLGYDADITDSPTFPVEVDGNAKKASISSIGSSGYEIQSVIFWVSQSIDGKDTYHYGLALKTEDDQWTIAAKIVSEADTVSPMLDELSIQDQFKRFEVAV